MLNLTAKFEFHFVNRNLLKIRNILFRNFMSFTIQPLVKINEKIIKLKRISFQSTSEYKTKICAFLI